MRPQVAKLGPVEWGFVGAVLVLIVAETAAFQGGLGAYFGIISVGYVLALVTAFLLYRHAKSTAIQNTGLGSILDSVDILSNLTGAERQAVVSLGESFVAPAGQVLGKAGEAGSHLFIIVEGKAQLSAPSAIGEVTVRTAGAGESFPLAALIGSGTLITTVTAMTDIKLLKIARSDLLALWKKNPPLGMRMNAAIAGVLANRYRATLAHLTTNAEQALKAVDFWVNV